MAPLTQNLSPAGTASGTVANIWPSGQNFLSVKFSGMSYTPYGPGRNRGGNEDFELVSNWDGVAAPPLAVPPSAVAIRVLLPFVPLFSVWIRLFSQLGRVGEELVVAKELLDELRELKPSNGVSMKSYNRYMPLRPR